MKGAASKPKKIKYKEGDVFLVPSSDGSFYVGQIALDTKTEIGAIYCYLFDKRLQEASCETVMLASADVISAALITPELVEYQQWKICAHRPVPSHQAIKKIDALREVGYVGARIFGSGNVADYLDTYYGVMSPSQWPDPNHVFSFFLQPPSARTVH